MIGEPRTSDWQFKPLLNAWHYLNAGSDRFVITTASQLENIGKLPNHVEVVARTPYFLRNEELILLGTRPSLAQTPADLQVTNELR